LAAIHAGTEMLIRAKLSESDVQRLARNLYGASVRMQELLQELVERCRGGQEEPEIQDLRALARAAVNEIAPDAEPQCVEVVQHVPAGLLVAVDRRRLHRVLVNLLVNALEAMPGGGAIYISARRESGAVVVRVRDTGPGIPPEIRGRLFQPFASAGKPDGIGLGLACARKAVMEDGGELWVEPSLQGACFVLRLPALPRAGPLSDAGALDENAANRRSCEERLP
jgi:signal transduction histidine kinase